MARSNNSDIKEFKSRFSNIGLTYDKVMRPYYFIRQRCYNKKCNIYRYYGARGILSDITKEEYVSWFIEEYPKFCAKYGKEERYCLSRIDRSRNYSVSNLELLSVRDNILEQYQRRGNFSTSGTKLDDMRVLTIHTLRDVPVLQKTYSVSRQAIHAVLKGRNFRKIYEVLYA